MDRSEHRILFIIGGLAIGGAETHLSFVLPALVKRGWKVKLVTFTEHNDLGPSLEQQGVVLKRLYRQGFSKFPALVRRPLRFLRTLFLLCREIKSEPLAISHYFLPESYMIGMIAAFLTRERSLKIMSRRSLNRYKSRRLGLIGHFETAIHRYCRFILANSRTVLKELQELERIPLEKMGIIYNGIDVSRFKEEDPGLALPERQDLTFIIVANLIPYKGHADLLQAFHIASPSLPTDWKIMIVGDDLGIGSSLKQMACDLGISDHIQWLGKRNDVPQLLKLSDVGILCSHEEGFSNAILEGMAAGLPMIVTNVGGNAEAVLHGKTGLVVPPKAPKSLAEAVLFMADKKHERLRMGELAKKRVAETFTLPACVDRYEAIYKSLLAGREPNRSSIQEITVCGS